MTKLDSALSKVQNLYVLQVHLWNVLDAKNLSPAMRNEAKKQLREFASLLRSADWHVMGGEDVYTALKQMQADVARKLKGRGTISQKPSVRGRAGKKR
ncbi:hypothetical protein A3C37_00245 [Candidatus Peribacteria bacterium RIFCSPHIGHO2_02_FULL_53_20]|nr:MAG: hypothetical protein A3C37_00245 [Candidatus Peribacteria bacterium RIFCSPHIGHO2_02_FULL_53_20]OGJ67006.1 MAG: hypothetical protein A3B61_04560 [Candidatus Peribacteria bacterium RIFCSPLOWO2_01_FULL_53_10]OGJ71696.1 MAG: hypothetical protein A3G69_04140 [Candidatus Peribacteria bacterium RIFCSPLOWO2_12_FULL_53_10]